MQGKSQQSISDAWEEAGVQKKDGFRMMRFVADGLKKFLVKVVLGNITSMELVSSVFLICGFTISLHCAQRNLSLAVIPCGLGK